MHNGTHYKTALERKDVKETVGKEAKLSLVGVELSLLEELSNFCDDALTSDFSYCT